MDGLNMILIKGEPKTQQIVTINEDKKGVYWVRFTNGKTYHLANRDVNILKSPKIISPVDCRIANKMGHSFHPLHIWEFCQMVKMVISYYSQIAEVPICSQYHFTVSLSPSSNDLIGQYPNNRFALSILAKEWRMSPKRKGPYMGSISFIAGL